MKITLEGITVAQYDAAEQSAMRDLCNRVIACSKPVTFLHVDYPVTVEEDAELARYVDVMQEGRFDHYFSLLGGLTDEEFRLFKEINRHVASFTEERYGKRKVAGAAVLSSIYMLRYLRALYPPGSTILELGPGCGYLGALLVMTGYAYIASDITQAFYLYQNHLLNAVTDGQLVELAVDKRPLSALSEIRPGTPVHVPWWKYIVPEPIVPFRVHCVSPNHMLCEMSNIALSFNLRLWSQLGSDIAFDGWGSDIIVPTWLVAKRLSEAGFVFAYSDHCVHVLVPGTSPAAIGAHRLPNTERTPSEMFVNLRRYGDSGFERIYRPPSDPCEANVMSLRIAKSENTGRGERVIMAEEASAFLLDLLGKERTDNADETFFRFIGHRF